MIVRKDYNMSEKIDLAVKLFHEKKYKECIDAFSSVLETEPDNADFYNNFYLRGKKAYIKWNKSLKIYKQKYPEQYHYLMKTKQSLNLYYLSFRILQVILLHYLQLHMN